MSYIGENREQNLTQELNLSGFISILYTSWLVFKLAKLYRSLTLTEQNKAKKENRYS